MAKKMLSTAEAAEIIGVSQRCINTYISAGRMDGVKEKGKLYVSAGDVQRVKRERAAAEKAKAKAKAQKEKAKAKKGKK